MFDHISPFNNRNDVRITQDVIDFIAHKACVGQSVKIEVVNLKVWTVVHLTNGKCRAGYFVFAACPARQATYKRGFATAKVTN